MRVGDSFDDKDGRSVDRAAENAVAGAAGHRQRLARQQRFIAGCLPQHDPGIGGNAAAGADAEPVPSVNGRERHDLAARIALGGRRREVEQSADRGGRAAPGAGLEELAEEDEEDDHPHRLKEHRHAAVRPTESGGKDPREDRCYDAHGKSHEDSERDQGEHRRLTATKTGQPAGEDLPSAPEQDRRGEEQLQPIAPGAPGERDQPGKKTLAAMIGGVAVAGHPHHCHRHQNRRQHATDPQASSFAHRRSDIASILPNRLERHPADRTGAWLGPRHLRVHRAGPTELTDVGLGAARLDGCCRRCRGGLAESASAARTGGGRADRPEGNERHRGGRRFAATA